MKFSIILPVYNVEKYLHECVDSILRQKFKDYEIVLVVDGSTDGSPAICDKYAEEVRSVSCLHQANSGQSLATGDYVLFIDSDDFVMSEDFCTDAGAVFL